MWVLVLVLFSGPMEISRTEVLEYHWNFKDCSKRVDEARKVGLPKNSNIGCMNIKHISKT